MNEILLRYFFKYLEMSYLFREKKRYFDFLESLEKEEQEFRRINQEFAMKSEICNNEYKIRAKTATHTLRRIGAREIRKVDPKSLTSKPRAVTSINKSRTNKPDSIKYKNSTQRANNESFLNTSPARLVSSQWPVRPNSAYRILAPVAKLRKYDEMNEEAYKKTKDPPLIHGTGILTINYSTSNYEMKNGNTRDNIFTHTQSTKTDNDSSIVLDELPDEEQ